MQVISAFSTLTERFIFRKVDARVYDLARIAFSIGAFANFLCLFPYRFELFDKNGMVSGETVAQLVKGKAYYSVFQHLSTQTEVTLCFLVFGLFIALLGLGVFTRLSAIVVFIWHLSYTYYSFPVMHGWDALLRNVSFLLMMSPIGNKWCFDRKIFSRFPSVRFHDMVPVYGLNLLRLQVCVIYFQTLWLKTADEYWRRGDFMSYYLLSMYSSIADPVWASLEHLSALLTYGVLAVEFAMPILFLKKSVRFWGFALGYLLHGMIALLTYLWLFSLCTVSLYFVFLEDVGEIKGWFAKKPVEDKINPS